MNIFRVLAFAVVALAVPAAAEAHPGFHVLGGAGAGLSHPFSGLDHLLAMVAVGLWAGLLGGRARWLVPAAFVVVMAAGAVLGAGGIALPAVEIVIAASIVVTGALIAASVRVAAGAAMAIVAAFALFHGHAHGAEMPALASPLAYGLGFVAATAMLHGAGLLAAQGSRAMPVLTRLSGGAIAATGLALTLPV